MLIVVAVFGTLFAAMPLMGLGADVAPEADDHLEQRYGNVGFGLAIAWTVLMVLLAVLGLLMQFRQRPSRPRRGRR